MSGHGHGPGGHHGEAVDQRARRAVLVAVALAFVATLVGLVALWPRGDAAIDREEAELLAVSPLEASVVAVDQAVCPYSDPAAPQQCETVSFEVSGEPREDSARPEFVRPLADGASGQFERGDRIYVTRTDLADGTTSYSFYDFRRQFPLTVLTVLFVLAVVALGRWRGVGAIGGLLVSMLVLAGFLLPAILHGRSPILAAVVAASLIAFVALYLAHGFNVATSVALLGTFGALLVTIVVSWITAGAAHLTGLADENAYFLQALGTTIDLRGIVLAGFVIGALGVLDDVTVTQVAAVWELHHAQPALPARELYRSAVRIGRDHISSTVNTLFLAYAGAALPLLLLFTQARQSFGTVASQEIVATEIVRSLAGSIGLVAAVPLTTGLAVIVLRGTIQGASPQIRSALPDTMASRSASENPSNSSSTISRDFGHDETGCG